MKTIKLKQNTFETSFLGANNAHLRALTTFRLDFHFKLTESNERCYEDAAQALQRDALRVVVLRARALQRCIPILGSQIVEKVFLLK